MPLAPSGSVRIRRAERRARPAVPARARRLTVPGARYCGWRPLPGGPAAGGEAAAPHRAAAGPASPASQQQVLPACSAGGIRHNTASVYRPDTCLPPLPLPLPPSARGGGGARCASPPVGGPPRSPFVARCLASLAACARARCARLFSFFARRGRGAPAAGPRELHSRCTRRRARNTAREPPLARQPPGRIFETYVSTCMHVGRRGGRERVEGPTGARLFPLALF